MSEFIAFLKLNPFVIGILMVGIVAFGMGIKASFEIWQHRNDGEA